MKLGKLAKVVKAEEEEVVPTINVATNPKNGARIVSFELPQFKKLTDAERAAREEAEGKDAVAFCDATGTLIFNAKNMCIISNKERSNVNDLTLSYEFVRKLMTALRSDLKPSFEK